MLWITGNVFAGAGMNFFTAELDRMVPLCAVLNRTSPELLPDLSIPLLLERDDLLPPVPELEEEEL